MTANERPASLPDSPSERLRRLFLSGIGGSSADYAEFLRQLVPVIRRQIRHKLADSEVDDVAQEVLMSVHKARHTYDGARQLMPWLHAIIQFRLNDHLREHYRHHTDRDTNEVDLDLFFADVTSQGRDREYIEQLLEGLPELQQQILLLLYVEGYTAKEVGDKVTMTESAVKVAAHRSIHKIRQRHGL